MVRIRRSSGETAPEATPWWSRLPGDAIAWAISLAGFAYAFVKALAHQSYDLRTAPVLVLDAALATALALGYAAHNDALQGNRGILRCLHYGLWSAALFQLTATPTNESVIFDTSSVTFDVPYILLFAAVHGAIVMLFACPFARRTLQVQVGLRGFEDDESAQVMIASILVFFLVAAGMRLLAG